ncbi:MAG: 2OG-Fe(II) oxygenase [Planctomycetota bacterium]
MLVHDDVLGRELALSLLADVSSRLEQLRPAGIGPGAARQRDEQLRGDEIVWLDPPGGDHPPGPIWHLFSEIQQQLNEKAWLGIESFEVQLARYSRKGARYVRHRDAFDRPENRRVATAVYYLNPEWQPRHGGCLRVFEPDGPRDLEPLFDRLVIFLSDRVEHEVLPVESPRWAITAWFLRRGILPLDPDPHLTPPRAA